MPDSRARCLLVLAFLVVTGTSYADEGMWTYDHFPTARMQEKYGWAPDAAWLRHAQLSSIRLAQGCSASLVSSEGLVMTNHHCARACLAELSDAQHDYIANGFYAVKPENESKCPTLEANQLVEIVDVTHDIDLATAGKRDRAFHEAERAAKSRIEAQCATSTDVRCQVVTLYAGGVYDLYKFKRYQDLRLVFAPEETVAFFGGDPDNFTFPRFDLDVAFVRIYDHGKPLQSANYLKFSRKPVHEGDLAFSSGNPGSTERALTASELKFQRDTAQPFIVTLYSELRGLLNEFATKGAEEARVSSTIRFSVENSLKAYKGRQQALVEGSVLADKVRDESRFRQRVAADPQLSVQYADSWPAIDRAMQQERLIFVRHQLLERMPQRFSPLLARALWLNRYASEWPKPDGERLEEFNTANFPAMRSEILSTAPVEKSLERTFLAWWLSKVREDLGTSDADVQALLGSRSPEEIANELVDSSGLADPAQRAALLNGGPTAINSYHDPLIDFARKLDVAARAVRDTYEDSVKAVVTRNSALIAKAHFALDGMNSYPDATFTLRISFGAVQGYDVGGRHIEPTTNFAGAYAHATGRDPFKLPAAWLAARGVVNPTATLDFTTTNDIIGGNSGSPVIGRDGSVMGLIFDGNIQSLGGSFGYDGRDNRAIAVDVTGITEALAHIYFADRLVEEVLR